MPVRRIQCFRFQALGTLAPLAWVVNAATSRPGVLDAWNGPREARGRKKTRSEAVRVAWMARGSQDRPRGRRAATYFRYETCAYLESFGRCFGASSSIIDLCGVLWDEYSERWGLENVSNRRESERKEPRSGIGSSVFRRLSVFISFLPSTYPIYSAFICV